jgi:spermidine synthase
MKKRIIQTSVIFLVALTAGVVSSAKINVAYWDKTILYEGESTYNYLRVEEESDRYILSTNVLFGVQSVKMKNKGLTGMYYDYALASPVMSGAEEKPLSVLILGLGTGTFASLCYDYFNSVSVDGVEIDGKIVDLAREYFALPDAVNVAVEDGRAFLNMSKSKYDVIMVDAYRDITIPFQMSTVEFFTSVQEHLSARGTMILNMNMYSDLDGGIDDYMVGTIASVFSSVYTVVTGGTNIELYASSVFDCKAQLDSQLSLISGHSDLSSMMSQVSANMVKRTANGYILTDDKAPVEKLGMDVLDDYVADELAYYQRKLRGMSLKEIWDSLMNGSFF